MAVTEDKITPEMTIEEILTRFPGKGQRLAHALTQAGLHCVGCHAATWETLEAGMLGHGYEKPQIQKLIDELNKIISEQVNTSTITLTQRAADKYQEILAEEGKEGYGLRLSEKAAGCSGLEYTLDYSPKAMPDDTIFTCHGVEVHIKNTMLERLMGCEVDYVDGLQGSGFKISNPNVRSVCGCGTSHNY